MGEGGWKVWNTLEEQHVYEDDGTHIMSVDCPCEPYKDRTEDGRLRVNHSTQTHAERVRDRRRSGV